MKKSIFLLFAVMLTMLSATAATHTVTQITDNGTGATSGSLSWAINTAAATGDVIAFNLTTGDVVTLSAALPTIDKSFTMEGINIATGNPVTIQVASPGVSQYRVFHFNAQGETCTLNDLIMRGGDVSGFLYTPTGGVIYLYGGTLALNRCVVKEGKAQTGGGITSSGPTSYLLLDGCTVKNNTATSATGRGGGCAVSIATILNSTITGNTSLSYGGGISQSLSQQNLVRLQIINTTISGNSAVTGGGIYTLGGPSHTTACYLLNDIVINNTATSNPDIGKNTGTDSNIYPYYLWSSYTTATVKTPYATGDLGALADNGGPTLTMALSASAPAYQTGTSAYYNATDGYYYHNGTAYVKLLGGTPATPNETDKITTDQRGATRDATPSMGAYDGTMASALFSGGTGTEADPYQIETLDDLEFLSENSTYWASGTYFTQTADIDASATSTWNAGAGFSPIGNSTTQFQGNYDGGNFTIDGIFINSATSLAGMFGYVATAGVVNNLGVTNVNFTGQGYAGGLATVSSGTINNCYSTGTVTTTSSQYYEGAGGLVGSNYGTISNSYSTCTVSGDDEIGGFAGINNTNATITKCYSNGSAVATGDNAGGFVGINISMGGNNEINNCYSLSNVQGVGSVGGFVGKDQMNMGNAYIKKCYSAGAVTGTTNVGGFVGSDWSDTDNIFNTPFHGNNNT